MKRRIPKLVFMVSLAILVVALLLVAACGDDEDNGVDGTPTPSPTGVVEPTPTLTPTTTASPTPSPMVIPTPTSTPTPEVFAITDSIASFWDAYNDEEYGQCLLYLTSSMDEGALLMSLTISKELTGEVVLESISDWAIENSSATAMVTTTVGGETEIDLVPLIKVDGKWKLVWEIEEQSPTPTPTPTPLGEGVLPQLQVHFIDVGQGDSILIDSGEIEVLIDGGGKSPGVVGYLNNHVDGALEVMVATHPHADHIDGLIAILGAFEVNQVWHNGDTADSNTYEEFMNGIEAEGACWRCGLGVWLAV